MRWTIMRRSAASCNSGESALIRALLLAGSPASSTAASSGAGPGDVRVAADREAQRPGGGFAGVGGPHAGTARGRRRLLRIACTDRERAAVEPQAVQPTVDGERLAEVAWP